VPYSTIRPAIFSASLLAAAREVRASRTWTGLAGSGRMALIDHRDVPEAGLRELTDRALWGTHHDLTGPAPMSWPEALEPVSAELGEPVSFRVAAERQYLERLTAAGVPVGEAELLITREWAILAGENDYTTDTFQQITGRLPRPSSCTSTARNSSDARAACADTRTTHGRALRKAADRGSVSGLAIVLAGRNPGDLGPVLRWIVAGPGPGRRLAVADRPSRSLRRARDRLGPGASGAVARAIGRRERLSTPGVARFRRDGRRALAGHMVAGCTEDEVPERQDDDVAEHDHPHEEDRHDGPA
jgi:hypothetical protein